MLSAEIVKIIQKTRNTTDFSTKFIIDFDKEWGEVVEQLRRSRFDLGAIELVSK